MTPRRGRWTSIGIAVFPDDGPDLSTLLRKADITMYKAKASGDGHHAYDGADDTDGATRLAIGQTMRTNMGRVQIHAQNPRKREG